MWRDPEGVGGGLAGILEERSLIWCVPTTPVAVKGSGLSDLPGVTKCPVY